MNKITSWIKNILSIFVLILMIKYAYNFGFFTGLIVLYYIIFAIYLIISLKDFYKKDKPINDNLYNVICILTLLVISFIFLRVFYDKGFIYNSQYINLLDKSYQMNMISDYMNQNMTYFLLLMILLLSYHFINSDKKKDALATSKTLFVISMLSIIPSIYVITKITIPYKDAGFGFVYFIIMLCFLGLKVFRFMQGKYRKYKYLFIIPVVFDLFGIAISAIQLCVTLKH